MRRDEITTKPATASGSTRNVSAGRIKSISGGGPNFSGANASTKSAPAPNSPYAKR